MIIDQNYSLRQLEKNDAEALFDILNRQREQMRVWLPFVDNTLEAEDIRESMPSFATPPNIQFCILYDKEVIGLIGFKDTDIVNKRTEIGYWLSFDYQGKGVMTQAVRRLLSYAFRDMQMNRVVIRVAEGNQKSRSIPECLGFKQEGMERDGELLVDNVYTDIVVYSLLKKDYLEQKENENIKISR